MQQKWDRKLRYSANRVGIPSDMMKDMENPYRKCEDHLQPINKSSEPAGEDQIKNLKVLKEFAGSFGLNIDLE